jgi:hypothetical protein
MAGAHGIARALAGLMGGQARVDIGGDAGVVTAIGTFKQVDKPRGGNGGHRAIIPHPAGYISIHR